MRRKVMVLALVALAFVLLAGPVLAGPSRGARVISMSGTITSDPSNGTFKVYVQMTNKPWLVKRTQTMLVKTDNAVFYEWIAGTRYPSDFSDLAKYDRVVINGLVIDDNTIQARRVEVNKRGY